MRSTEKVRQALSRAEAIGDEPDAPMMLKTAATALAMFRGTVEGMIPTNPDELDELLGRGAGWLLALRSDDALAMGLVIEEPDELPAGER